jgi:DNA polymerase-3 subunit epsilon
MTEDQVAGHHIDPAEVTGFIAPNASFDRCFAETFCGTFVEKPWACSLNEVDWAAEGFKGSRLGHLAMRHGLFVTGHRALHDCQAALYKSHIGIDRRHGLIRRWTVTDAAQHDSSCLTC